MLPILNKLKKAFVIEEVEEIYGDIFGKLKMAQKERGQLQYASAYIYPTKLLNPVVNRSGKPFWLYMVLIKIIHMNIFLIKHLKRILILKKVFTI